MAFEIYTLSAINIATAEDVDLLIDQITGRNLDLGIQKLILAADGQVDPTYGAVGSQAPRTEWTTTALATILAACGIDGLKISSGVGDAGLEMWFQKYDEGGVLAPGANHEKMTINKGLLIPQRITLPHSDANTPGSMDMLLVITSDGTNDPIVFEASASLEGSPGVGEIFVAGPVNFNGVQYDGVQEIIIDFGIDLHVVGGDGLVYPTYAAIKSRRPTISVRTVDASKVRVTTLSGTAQDTNDSVIYARKVARGGTRVVDGTAEHISFTLDDGFWTCNNVGGDTGEIQTPNFEFSPISDGAAAIIVINTAAAIT